MPEHKRISGWTVGIVAIIAVALWVGNLWIGLSYSGKQTFIGERGTFGDVFGAVNSLFTGMAFVGVIYSITMQREELGIARSEMQQTKSMLGEQQTNLRNQNLATKKQVFESTFFRMLDRFVTLTDSIDIRDKNGETLKGKDAIGFLFKELQRRYFDSKDIPIELLGGDPASRFDRIYSQFFHDYGHEISHYFRTLYTVLNFVERSEIEDKAFYMKLVRAQLSDSEAALLLCNYLSQNTTERFNLIQEKYGMLKNVDKGHLIVKDNKHLVKPEAFGRSQTYG
ncbi:MAG: putative phage abortive infection protein [Sulfitobacter sp.]